MRFLLHLFCFFVLSLKAFCSGKVLPDFKNEQEKQAFQLMVQKLIPFSGSPSGTVYRAQQEGLAVLRQEFKDYDRWMAEKPSPITIEIFKEVTAVEQTAALNPEMLQIVRQRIQSLYEKETNLLAGREDQSKLMWDRALQHLVDSLEKSSASVRGILVGLGQILSPEQKKEFFTLGDPLAQVEYLKELEISDQTLRTSRFKASTLGLAQESIAMSEVFAQIERRMSGVDEVFNALSYLKALSKIPKGTQGATSDAIKMESTDPLITSTDFEFCFKSQEDHFVAQLISDLESRQLYTRTAFLRHLVQFHKGLPQTYFIKGKFEVKRPTLLGKVIEVHPYLGVHRGCIGRDCSTSSSPMFPYSPWEHDFFIQNEKGIFVGYISGTRVKVDQEPTFFLRDLQGPMLSLELAEAILNTFPKVLENFGAKNFVMASSEFNGQNNSDAHRNLLLSYQKKGKAALLEFPDLAIRRLIQARPEFRSQTTYDSAERYPRGTTFVAMPDFETKYSWRWKQATLEPKDPANLGQAFLETMRVIAVDPAPKWSAFADFSEVELKQALAAFKNETNEDIEIYFARVEKVLSHYGLKLTRSLRENNEELFIEGILNAPDAFSKDGFRSQSERYLIQLSRKHNNYFLVLRTVGRFAKELEGSARFQDLVSTYAERFLPHDIYQLVGFAAAGISSAAKALQNPEKKRKVEQALFEIALGNPETFGIPTEKDYYRFYKSKTSKNSQEWEKITSISKLYNLHQHLGGYEFLAVRDFISNALGPYQLKFEDLKDPLLKRYFYKALFKAEVMGAHTNKKHAEGMLSLFLQEARTGNLTNIEVLRGLFRVKHLVSIEHLYFEERVQELVRKRRFEDFVELSILINWQVPAALRALQYPELRRLYLVALNELVTVNGLSRAGYDFLLSVNNNKIELGLPGFDPEFYTLAQHVKTLHWNKANFDSFLQALESVAQRFGLQVEDLFSLEAISKHVAEAWLSYKTFAHSDPRIVTITLQFLIKHGRELGLDLYVPALEKNLNGLIHRTEFKEIVSLLEESFLQESCLQCGGLLALLIINKTIPDNITKTSRDIQRLIETKNEFAVTYAYYIGQKRNMFPSMYGNSEYNNPSLIREPKLREKFAQWNRNAKEKAGDFVRSLFGSGSGSCRELLSRAR